MTDMALGHYNIQQFAGIERGEDPEPDIPASQIQATGRFSKSRNI